MVYVTGKGKMTFAQMGQKWACRRQPELSWDAFLQLGTSNTLVFNIERPHLLQV
jgi:hypothetical protein